MDYGHKMPGSHIFLMRLGKERAVIDAISAHITCTHSVDSISMGTTNFENISTCFDIHKIVAIWSFMQTTLLLH